MRGAQEAIQRGAFLTPPAHLSAKPNVRTLLTTAAEIASGMAFLHSRGITHGDLSGGGPPHDMSRLSLVISCLLASCFCPHFTRHAKACAEPLRMGQAPGPPGL